MAGNRGHTTLRLKRRNEDPMREYDRLPVELRCWLASAVLPWRPKSVRQAYETALARTQNKISALRELDRLQERLVAKDASRVWGRDHPHAAARAGP